MTERDTPAEQALIPMAEKTVNFYGDPIPVAQTAPDVLYVPLRPLTTFLGLAFGSQRNRVMRDRVLAAQMRQVVMTSADGKHYETLCLPLDLIPGWLFGIDTSRVKPELVDKLDRYRAECFRVLWNAFKQEILPTQAPVPTDLSGAEQALILAEAVASLAREHLELEKRHTTMADYMRGYVQRTTATLQDHGARLQALELRLSAGATISEDQASEIALTVKNVAKLLEKRSIANPYQQVWGELYRRFRVAAYRNLPAARYDEVMAWLNGWYTDLQGAQDQKES